MVGSFYTVRGEQSRIKFSRSVCSFCTFFEGTKLPFPVMSVMPSSRENHEAVQVCARDPGGTKGLSNGTFDHESIQAPRFDEGNRVSRTEECIERKHSFFTDS